MYACCRFGLVVLVTCAIGAARGQDVRSLTRQLGDRDPSVRRKAASALSDLGRDAKAAVPGLTRALSDRDAYVRRFSAQALGRIGPDARSAVPYLAKALKDERREVAEAAVEALGKIRTGAVGPLTDAVKDRGAESLVRRKAIEALGEMGSEARFAVPVLVGVLGDREVRVQAAEALGAMGASARAAIPALKSVSMLKGGGNRDIRQAASRALRQIEQK